MLGYLCSLSNKAIAVFLVRWILGLEFALIGYHKTFTLGLEGFASSVFVERFADTWIPEPLLWAFGYSIPVVELAGGLLLLVGWRRREVLAGFAGLLIITTYGHLLENPFYDLVGHTLTYVMMIVFLLLLSKDDDAFTLDGWLAARKAG